MKIRIYLLRQDRTVKIVQVKEKKSKWLYNNGLYPINPSDIHLSAFPYVPNPHPEIIFCEGNPQAVGSKESALTNFDRQLVENFVQAAASVKSMWLQQLTELLFSPKIIFFAFGIIILVAFLSGVLKIGKI